MLSMIDVTSKPGMAANTQCASKRHTSANIAVLSATLNSLEGTHRRTTPIVSVRKSAYASLQRMLTNSLNVGKVDDKAMFGKLCKTPKW